jgi:hypothetical protein
MRPLNQDLIDLGHDKPRKLKNIVADSATM